MLSKSLRRDIDVPIIPDEEAEEIARFTQMQTQPRPLGKELRLLLMGLLMSDPGGDFRPPRWSARTRDELGELRETLRRARSQIEQLSNDARGFLGWRADQPNCPLRFIIRGEIGCIADVETAALALESKIQQLDSELRPRRGDNSKSTNQDELGTFYEFAALLTMVIIDRGGRATVDKNYGRGTLVAALRLIAPYFPKDLAVPGFLKTNDSTDGLHRLDRVRANVIRDMARRPND